MKITLSSLRSIVLSYSELFFLKSELAGLVILFTTLLNSNLGFSGLASILVAYAFARYVGYGEEFLKSGYYTYNTLLVGLAIGQLFTLSPLTFLFIAIASVITFLVTISFSDIFSKYFALPILSAPFVVVTSLIYLSASKLTNLYVTGLYATGNIEFLSDFFPYWLNGLFRCLGAILFMPSPAVGFVLLLIIFIQSRVLFLLAVAGYYFGILLQGAFIGSYPIAFADLNAFNYPLIAMALGGIFNIPSLKSYIFAFMGVAMSTVLIESIGIFWSSYGIPVFTLPFLIVTFVYIYALNLLSYPNRPLIFKDTPEETAEYFFTQQFRYPAHTTFYLPFTDEWSVYQGFHGEWTHKGIWAYAYDFVKRNKKGLTYENDGHALKDYFCFQQPVCSPCSGVVVSATDVFPDNPIGVVDTFNNWGNYIVIKDNRGYYVGICHLAQGSLLVGAGSWVAPFQPLARCGNSGYSPQPHIHMQYQVSPFLSSATIPFTFSAVLNEDSLYHHNLPSPESDVHPYFVNNFYLQVTNFVLDEKLRFKVYQNEKFIENISFVVRMALDSTFFLSRNTSRLYLGKSDSSFYFYHLEGNDPYLRMLYQALPSFPMTFAEGHTWEDIVPEKYFLGLPQQILAELKKALNYHVEKNATYMFESDTVVCGTIKAKTSDQNISTKITLDPYLKFSYFEVGDHKFYADKT